MEINKKNRTELKEYFKINDKPTQEEFADFIEAGLNQAEDGIAKVQGNPLSVQAEGETVGTQEVLDVYESLTDDNPKWSINLNPRIHPAEPTSNQDGFNIKDATGQSRLFIKSNGGNVGVGTLEPAAKLSVEGKNTASLFSVTDTTNNPDTILEVSQKEGVTVKGTLQVEGNLKATNISDNEELDNTATSHGKIATQKAVKTYIDTRLPKGLISMWSGQDIPKGWVLCDGTNNTPDLSGRFIVGMDKNNTEYQIGKKGGEEFIALTKEQMPEHTHTDPGHSHGVNDPGHNHNHGNFNGLVRFTGKDTTDTMDNNKGAGREFALNNYGTIQSNKTGITVKSAKTNLESSGGNEPHENRPPYFVLAYIMKL
ncbi:hypothetical protein D1818_16550 [Aquimarina sp. BL5]|uniref:hypothetical protein n=1 Tax=Aquimarina sp. BL5 TaxID=1714860 RepID=UPI000E4B9D68|nr:hypothetical protein [Aquimarina sp. BL5]AXT52371.1 hypothetical protein D1818_16550 [Aquimarina sp. BL5]RKN10285.1 hypothetical protein D7036_02930 [Aquimarina sp. BL5]